MRWTLVFTWVPVVSVVLACAAQAAPQAPPEGALRTRPGTPPSCEGGRVDLKQFGAAGDGAHDDTAALQSAIDAAARCPGATTGAAVFVPPGLYQVSRPLVLPRSNIGGAQMTRLVTLEGAGPFLSVLRGTAAFPTGRAMIEWEPVKAHALQQSISKLGLVLPPVRNTSGIRFTPTDKSTMAAVQQELLELDLADVMLSGNNRWHPVLVYLGGDVRMSVFRNVIADNMPWDGPGTLDTRMFAFDTEDYGHVQADTAGCEYCLFENIWAGYRHTGYSTLLAGRLNASMLINLNNPGGSLNDPQLDLRNCFNTSFDHVVVDGRGEKPSIRVENSSYMEFRHLSLGAPDDRGSGVGNGIEFHGVTDSLVDMRGSAHGVGGYTYKKVHFAVLDAASSRNRFLGIGINAPLKMEVQDEGADNTFEAFDHAGSRSYERRPARQDVTSKAVGEIPVVAGFRPGQPCSADEHGHVALTRSNGDEHVLVCIGARDGAFRWKQVALQD